MAVICAPLPVLLLFLRDGFQCLSRLGLWPWPWSSWPSLLRGAEVGQSLVLLRHFHLALFRARTPGVLRLHLFDLQKHAGASSSAPQLLLVDLLVCSLVTNHLVKQRPSR